MCDARTLLVMGIGTKDRRSWPATRYTPAMAVVDHTARTLVLVGLGLALLACDPPEHSDANKYLVRPNLRAPLGTDSRAVLVGSTFTFDVEGLVDDANEIDPDQGGLNCVSLTAAGALVETDGAFRVDGVGPGAVLLGDPALNCPANTDALATLGPDQWSIEGLAATEVSARWAYKPETDALAFSTSPGPRASFPPDFGAPLTTLRVVAGGHFVARPALVEREGEGEVRWSADDARLRLPPRYDELRPTYEFPDEPTTRGEFLDGRLVVGDAFTAAFELLDEVFTLPRVETTSVESITRMELVEIYWAGDARREWGEPAGVLAMTYDGSGRRIVGAPVEFRLTRGRLALNQDESGADVLGLADLCHGPIDAPTRRAATIEAVLGDLVARVELEWLALPEDNDNDPYPPSCAASELGCDVAAVDTSERGLALGLLVLALLGLARARQTSRRRAASTLAT